MKRLIGYLAMALLSASLLSACTTATEVPKETADKPFPVKVTYQRMWEYSASGESTDPEVIQALLNGLDGLKIGAETNMAVDDFGDIIRFEYPDGSERVYEFEGDIIVNEDGTRNEVEGLKSLRDLLNTLIEVK
jgi:hypothetical protein